METIIQTRAAFVPSGAIKVSDRASDAVAFIYSDAAGRPCAMGFAGRRTKPDFRFRYASEARREAAVREFFATRQARLAARQSHKAKGRKLEVGHLLKAVWGYEQTNVDFYQVTALIGATMVEVRKVAGNNTQETGWLTGKTVPRADVFTGEPLRRRADGDAVKIDDVRWARLWDGLPVSWTAYH